MLISYLTSIYASVELILYCFYTGVLSRAKNPEINPVPKELLPE